MADKEQLVGSHLSINMGYMDSCALFFTATETVNYRELETIDSLNNPTPNPLELIAKYIPLDTPAGATEADSAQETMSKHLSLKARSSALAHVNFYIDNFIAVVQGGRENHTKVMKKLSQDIVIIFCLNDTKVRDCLKPI